MMNKKHIVLIGGIILGILIPVVLLNPKKLKEESIIKNETTLSGLPTYFAEIDANNKVLRVIVASQTTIFSGKFGDPKKWIETSPSGTIRKNYAGKGFLYDSKLDAFIPPRPNSLFVLDTNAKWVSPIKNTTIYHLSSNSNEIAP